MGQLYQFGAPPVLVTGNPDIGLLPAYLGTSGEAERRAIAADYSEQMDDLLTAKLSALRLPAGTDLTRASLIDFSNRRLANPAAFHLANVTLARTAVQAGALETSGMSGFLFFDEVHP